MFKKMKGLCGKGECCGHGGKTPGVYCLGFIGALVFYLQNAGSFLEGVVGILKAMVWPAVLLYELLGVV